jgi:hypothetical protein
MGQVTFVHKAGKAHLNVDALSRLEREEKTDDREIGKGLRRITAAGEGTGGERRGEG